MLGGGFRSPDFPRQIVMRRSKPQLKVIGGTRLSSFSRVAVEALVKANCILTEMNGYYIYSVQVTRLDIL